MTLTYRDRGASGTQIDAIAGNLCVATLYKASPPAKASTAKAGDGAQWRWTFFLTAAPPGFEHQGDAALSGRGQGTRGRELVGLGGGGRSRRALAAPRLAATMRKSRLRRST